MVGLASGQPRPDVVADWLELQVLFGDRTVVSRSEMVAFLREEAGLDELAVFDEIGDLDTLDEQEFRHELRQGEAEGGDAATILADDTMLVLTSRATVVGDHYPFDVTGDGVRLRSEITGWRDAWAYAFLALLGARLTYGTPAETVPTNQPARLFERLVVEALRAYWAGSAKHVGFPRDDENSFRDAAVALSRDLIEPLAVKRSQIPGRIKDLAADAVAWRRMDERSGNSILLCQCAIGHDWESKGIKHEPWDVLIKFAVKPRTATAFPVVPAAMRDFTDVEWELLCANVGIPLDRLRLAALITPADVPDDLRLQIEEWVEATLPRILT